MAIYKYLYMTTVRIAKKFLEENPEEAEKTRNSLGKEFLKKSMGAPIISGFLGQNWSESRVQDSLRRLKLIKSGELNKEAVESIVPSPSAKLNFNTSDNACAGAGGKNNNMVRNNILYMEITSMEQL